MRFSGTSSRSGRGLSYNGPIIGYHMPLSGSQSCPASIARSPYRREPGAAGTTPFANRPTLCARRPARVARGFAGIHGRIAARRKKIRSGRHINASPRIRSELLILLSHASLHFCGCMAVTCDIVFNIRKIIPQAHQCSVAEPAPHRFVARRTRIACTTAGGTEPVHLRERLI